MKKFLASAVLFLTAFSASAEWTDAERADYKDMMFQTAMEYETYTQVFSIQDTLKVIDCIGVFYETNYTFEEFEHLFLVGNDNTIEEFTQVNMACMMYVEESKQDNKQEFL